MSGVTLKPRKCVLVLTSVLCSEENIQRVRTWLKANIPQWASMQIARTGKYLGVYLGPGAQELQWVAPIKKFQERVDVIWGAHSPAFEAALDYNSKAVSVSTFVSQFCPPPPNMKAL